MLLNLKFEIPWYKYIGGKNKNFQDIDHEKDFEKIIYSSLDKRINHHEGVFVFPDLNMNHTLEYNGIEIFESYKIYQEGYDLFKQREEKGLKWISIGIIYEALKMAYFGNDSKEEFIDSGVCDNYEQILEKMPYLKTSEQKYIITMCPIRKKDQPSSDGWRWEKWGEYIGTQNSEADYLYDEPEIDLIYVFHVYKIMNKEIKEEYKIERNGWVEG